jgi:threonyl-tRNA synthetase
VQRKLRAAAHPRRADDRNEKLGYRIRDAQVRKVPYTLVVGEREAQNGTAMRPGARRRGPRALPLERVLGRSARRDRNRSATLNVGQRT